MKNLLLIDGNSILNRAFFGIRSLSTKDGHFTNAIYGLVNVIDRELNHLTPDYAMIAFDLSAPTFRREMYEPYKANRHGMPDELHEQLDDAKACAELMGLHRVELSGFEADDVLGTIAAMAEKEGDVHAYILSGDRDLLQLISPQVSVLLAGNAETAEYDRGAFFARYGVEPGQLTEVKGLMGDSSDNIPGVAGVGEKTALKLIAAHGTLEGVYDALDAPDVTRSLRAKLENGRDMAFLSRTLATIRRDAPVGCTLADLAFRGPDKAGLRQKFIELEFTALIRKFGLDEADAASPAAVAATPDYRPATAEEILSAPQDAPVALCLSGETLYINIKEENFAFSGDVRSLAPLFSGERTLITYDAKALHHFLSQRGQSLDGIPRDLMLYAYAIDAANGTVAPDALCTAYLGQTPPAGEPYAHLLPALEAALSERVDAVGAGRVLRDIELPLCMLLSRMEERGFKLDRAGMEHFRGQLENAMNATAEKIYYLAGETFNLNSPRQLGQILFEKLGLPVERKTKTGYSTDSEVLNHLRRIHPIVGEILDYRQISKLYATYAVGLLKMTDENDRLHTDFKQALTATGRLSSAEPNLQNIPIRTELGREMRRYFIPENSNYVLIDADYSQIELRLLAHMAQDEAMIAGFLSGADIHTATAATVFGVAPEEVTEELRKRAKAVNFGIVYGIGAYSLAGDLGVSMAQAKSYIDAYYDSYPRIREYMRATVAAAYENGYVTTLYGRRRSVPELRSSNKVTQKFGERVAMNSPIQGTAADIMKIAMLRVDRRLREEGLAAYPVMQVHDELVLEAERGCAERAATVLREEMEGAAKLSVPLTVDVTMSDTWLE